MASQTTSLPRIDLLPLYMAHDMAHKTPRRKTSTSDRPNAAWKLKHAPDSEAPSLGGLQDQVAARQTRRNIRRKRLVGATAGCLLGLFVVTFFQATTEAPTANINNVPPLSDSGPPERGDLIAEQTLPDVHVSPRATVPISQPSLRLFANVQASAPVFINDEQTGAFFPVGWLRSSGQIPVDLSAFSSEQMETFHAVLNDVPRNVSL